MRGKLAVPHYTGSVINVLLDVLQQPNTTTTPPIQTYANIAKKFTNPNEKRVKFGQTASGCGPAQPQLGNKTFAQMSGQFNRTAGRQYNQKFIPSSGINRTPLVGNYQYNVETQNRFAFPASGN